MARLSDLVNVNINNDVISIQGMQIPVSFTFESFPYIEESYGKTYGKFEKDINAMLKKKTITLGEKEIKLMRSLIYAMIRSGGTDCTVEEVKGAIPISDLVSIFEVAFDIFNRQNFQIEDMEKIKIEKKS